MLRLFVLFTVASAAELAVLIAIGTRIGPLPTFLMLVVSGLVGSWLAKREGLAVVRQLAQDVQTGLPPADRLVEGALVAAGGLLLVTPGFLSDLAGLALLFPATRRRLAPHVLAWARRNVTVQGFRTSHGLPPEPPPPERPPGRPSDASPFDHPVA